MGRDGGVWLGTSWKMTKTIAEALAWVDGVEDGLGTGVPGVTTFVLPAHTALAAVRDRLAEGPVAPPLLLGAQNAHWAREGAGTGEISMRMAADAGAELIEIGHSERRASFGEDDRTVALKVRAALDAGLRPLVCVGEPEEVRDAGDESAFVSAQVEAALGAVHAGEHERVLLAYEPVWAIGEHGRRPETDEVAPVLGAVAELGAARAHGPAPTVLYGGSVDLGNAAALLGVDAVDGLFVGRSAWTAEGFLALAEVARSAAARRRAGQSA
jgi:L-erythrulose 1-phosphate isomerase